MIKVIIAWQAFGIVTALVSLLYFRKTTKES